MQFLNFLKKDKIIILFSSIIIVVSVFFWDLKNEIFQAKYLISILLIYNLILFEKKDTKYYLYILGFCLLLFVHLIFINGRLIIDKYIIFSLFFLYIYLAALYKIHPFFEKILNKSNTLFMLFLNIIFFFELVSLDFYLYDQKKFVNGLCVICHKINFPFFNLFFTENSHLGMISAAVILYSFAKFKEKNKFEKFNIVMFSIINFIFFLSLTLLLGIILSSIFILIFGLLGKFKAKNFIIWPIVFSLFIVFLIPNCWARIYQVLNLENLYDKSSEGIYSNKIGKKLSNLKVNKFDDNRNESELTKKFNEIKKNQEKFFKLILNPNFVRDILEQLDEEEKEYFKILLENIRDEYEPIKLENKLSKLLSRNLESYKISLILIKEVKKDKRIDQDIVEAMLQVANQDVFKMILNEYKNLPNISLEKYEGLDETEFSLNKIHSLNIRKNRIFNTLNVTTIVHLNHYMVTLEALAKNPIGYGFQNYKTAGMEFAKANNMVREHSDLKYLNINDGSNNFNKILVEFGYLSVLLIILFFIFHIKTDLNNNSKIFIFTILITQLLRAAGYFNGGFLFVVIVGTLSVFIKQKK